ncbi:FCD domain-containing protein [Roseovarius azorensis]|uniref:FCD domain-containing protein n=1 Tax=Roseovarius azorensis TaxID=1287727 RepID=A0A1H7QGT7_9RHOB|nr:FCD domain-containing protein [Roseovarius azorensis]
MKKSKFGWHLDFKFHHAVAMASGNHRFAEAISVVEYDIDNAVNLARYLVRYDHLERAQKVRMEHMDMYQAIADRDADKVRALMADHLYQARARMLSSRSTSNSFAPAAAKAPVTSDAMPPAAPVINATLP